MWNWIQNWIHICKINLQIKIGIHVFKFNLQIQIFSQIIY
jgi:hypothetical protein